MKVDLNNIIDAIVLRNAELTKNNYFLAEENRLLKEELNKKESNKKDGAKDSK